MASTSRHSSGFLTRRVAIITGSSSGIGRAIALRYASEGAAVVCGDLKPTARLPDELAAGATHEVIQSMGGMALFKAVDVANAEEMRHLVQEAVKIHGRVDILVNNAGIALETKRAALCHETDEDVWDKTMQVNAKSVFLGCKFALAQMMKQQLLASGCRGRIINISSIYGLVGGGLNPSYCASKGAVANLTRQIAFDYGPHSIACNAINPGHISTAIWEETRQFMVEEEALMSKYPMGRTGRPEDVADAAVFLASDQAKFMTGVCMPVDGGYTCH